jgi:peptidoglycan/LPS O-acetylase OafA/YrhL
LFILPIFPSGSDTAVGYATIFAPVFLGGIALALYHSQKIGYLLACYLVVLSFVAAVSAQTSIRPDTLWSGPILLIGYIILLISYVFRHRFFSSKIVTLLASYTYTVYLLHKRMIPYIEQTLVKWLNLSYGLFARVLAPGPFSPLFTRLLLL